MPGPLGDARTRDAQTRDAQARDPQARDPQTRDPQTRDPQTRDAKIGATAASIYVLFLLTLLWLPLPMGSNRAWSWSLLEFSLLGLAGWWLVGCSLGLRGYGVPPAIRGARVTLLAWLVGLGYVGLQMVELPWSWVEALSPGSYRIHQLADVVTQARPSVSVDPGSTLAAGLRYASYLCAFFLCIAVVNTSGRVRWLALAIIAVGALEALYGLSVYASKGSVGLWDPSRLGAHDLPGTHVTGTYVNRNHFGGLLEIAIGLNLGLLLADSGGRSRGTSGGWLSGVHWRSLLLALCDDVLSPTLALRISLVVMICALLLSGSRGAIGSLMVSVVLVGGLHLFTRRRRRVSRSMGWILGAMLIAAAWVGSGPAVDKFLEHGLSSNRQDIRAAVYPMVADNWLTGWGAGTFQWVFPQYKTTELGDKYYHHAHNDYLQLWAEQGLLGFGLFMSGVVGLGYALSRRYVQVQTHGDRFYRGTLTGALIGVGALAIHAWVDFNHQIPANATYFFVVLALAWVAASLASSNKAGRLMPGASYPELAE